MWVRSFRSRYNTTTCYTYRVLFAELSLKVVAGIYIYTQSGPIAQLYLHGNLVTVNARNHFRHNLVYCKSNNISRFLTRSSRRARLKTKTGFRHLLARLCAANHWRDCQQLVNTDNNSSSVAGSHSRTHARTH